MRKIVFSNHKGGCGKSTSSLCIAQALKESGHNVLLIDLDTQANLTSALIPNRVEDATISDMLLDQAKPEPIKTEQGIDLFPAGLSMARNENKIKEELQHETLLRRFLEDLDTSAYDYCVIDCPPNLGTYTILALMAADVFYIPLQPEFFGATGLMDIVEFTERVRKFNKGLQFGGIFVTRTHKNDRRRIVQALLEQLKKTFGPQFLDVFIRESVSIPESQFRRRSIYDYDPECTAAVDYMELTQKILSPETV